MTLNVRKNVRKIDPPLSRTGVGLRPVCSSNCSSRSQSEAPSECLGCSQRIRQARVHDGFSVLPFSQGNSQYAYQLARSCPFGFESNRAIHCMSSEAMD